MQCIIPGAESCSAFEPLMPLTILVGGGHRQCTAAARAPAPTAAGNRSPLARMLGVRSAPRVPAGLPAAPRPDGRPQPFRGLMGAVRVYAAPLAPEQAAGLFGAGEAAPAAPPPHGDAGDEPAYAQPTKSAPLPAPIFAAYPRSTPPAAAAQVRWHRIFSAAIL